MDDCRVAFELSRVIDADMYHHAVSPVTGVIFFRVGRDFRRRPGDRFRCPACPAQGKLLPRVDRITVADSGCGGESKLRDAADRRGIQGTRARRRLDGDVRRDATAGQPENSHCHGSRVNDPKIGTACSGIKSQRRLRLQRIFRNGRELRGVDGHWNAQNHPRETRAKKTMHRDRQCSGADRKCVRGVGGIQWLLRPAEYKDFQRGGMPAIISASFSATMMIGAFTLPEGMRGRMEPSTMRKRSTPRTRPAPSVTAISSVPIRQVLVG